MAKEICKGYNRYTGHPCYSYAMKGGYCLPHAIRAMEEAHKPEVREPLHLATCPIGSVDWADCSCGDAY